MINSEIDNNNNITNSSPHLTPPTTHSFSNSGGSSPLRKYKLKTKWSPPIERPSSSMLPSLNSSGYDIYDVPRPSPIPSPYLCTRPRPKSSSAHSSLHSIIIGQGVENNYDVPRSMNDLCRVDSPYSTRLPLSTERDLCRGDSPYLTRLPMSTEHGIDSHYTSSSSDQMCQLTMLKDEYPDYDFPRSISIEHDDPDYDVPRSVRSLCTAGTKSEGNISFGALDKMIADIDSEIAGAIGNRDTEQELVLDTKTNEKVFEPDKVKDEPENIKDASLEEEQEIVSQNVQDKTDKTVSPPSASNTLNQQTTFDESLLANRVLRPLLHQPSSFPQITPPTQESTYDRLSARQALEQLKKDGIVPQNVQEVKKHSLDDHKENVGLTNQTNPLNQSNPPTHFTKLPNQSKVLTHSCTHIVTMAVINCIIEL